MQSNSKDDIEPTTLYGDLNTQKIKKNLTDLGKLIKHENSQFNMQENNQIAKNTLNLAISPQESKPSRSFQFNFASNTFQPKPVPKLEVVNGDKYNEIKENAGYLLLNNNRIKTSMSDLQEICKLGSGTCGQVIKMKHKQTGQLIAVKQMRISGVAEENKRIIMDLDVVLKCHSCENIVSCLGYFISDTDVWICMDLMTMCFDKLLKLICKPIPEHILGKLTLCTLNALNFLKQKHNVIHRDIKPSNLLINNNGEIKLCDFGISGNLVDSRVQTRNAGCAGYMAPERIELESPDYDIRADVWSLGITLVELATGEYPFKKCTNDFEVMSTILKDEPPKLEGSQFSQNFKEFVRQCLIKDVKKRPKYNVLLQNPFVLHYKNENVDVRGWFNKILDENKDKLNLEYV
jgi:mitogen-activated protein kinase kinase 7